MFIACHPVLSPEARVALTLRVVGGLSSEEIARAFLVPVPTVQARITRAKKTIAAAEVPFELPPPEERRERLGGVLSVLYVIFTEGSTATTGDRLLRPDLAYEAIRLARMLAALLPAEPEVHGLLALFELTAARFPARTGPDGEAVLLEDQDRRRWDRSAIRRGLAALGRASAAGRGLGPYGLQAAIAACHASAPSVRGDRLGAHRAPLRGARPGGAVARRRAQPGRRRRDGERAAGRRCPSSTNWSPPTACRGRTCSRACAANCSPGSAGPPRPGPSWSSPPGCAATPASGRCCCARRLPWSDPIHPVQPFRRCLGWPARRSTVRSSSSQRQVRTQRSTIAFMRGMRILVSTTSIPASARSASNGWGYLPSRARAGPRPPGRLAPRFGGSAHHRAGAGGC